MSVRPLAVARRRIERFDHQSSESLVSIPPLFREAGIMVLAGNVHADVDDGGGGSAPFRGRSLCGTR